MMRMLYAQSADERQHDRESLEWTATGPIYDVDDGTAAAINQTQEAIESDDLLPPSSRPVTADGQSIPYNAAPNAIAAASHPSSDVEAQAGSEIDPDPCSTEPRRDTISEDSCEDSDLDSADLETGEEVADVPGGLDEDAAADQQYFDDILEDDELATTTLPNGVECIDYSLIYKDIPRTEAIMAISLWAHKFELTTRQWSALSEVLRVFMDQDVPSSMSTLKKVLLGGLPLSKMYSKVGPGDPPVKIYFFDHKDILVSYLESAHEQIYFGPALYSDSHRSEFYHGDAWAESIRCTSGQFPRYPGPERRRAPLPVRASGPTAAAQGVNDEAIFPSDFIAFRLDGISGEQYGQIQRIWYVDGVDRAAGQGTWRLEVHRVLKLTSSIKVTQIEPAVDVFVYAYDEGQAAGPTSSNSYYMEVNSCRSQCLVVPVRNIIRRCRFDLPGFKVEDDVTLPVQGFITSMRYKDNTTNNRWRWRAAHLRHRTQAEAELMAYGRTYCQKVFVQRGELPIRSIPEVHFCDGFAVRRTMSKSSSGFYIAAAGLSGDARRKQDNWLTLTLSPINLGSGGAMSTTSAAKLELMVRCIAPSSRLLARGTTVTVDIGRGSTAHPGAGSGGLQEVRVVAFMLTCIGDMPQQQTNSGCRALQARRGCCRCLVCREDMGNLRYDTTIDARYDVALETATPSDYDELGLAGPSPWHNAFPGLVTFQSFPLEVAHSELKGMCLRYLDLLMERVLTGPGTRSLSHALSVCPLPRKSGGSAKWARFQMLSHRQAYGYSELGKPMLIMPYLLMHLRKADIKPSTYQILIDMYPSPLETTGTTAYGLAKLVDIFAELADHLFQCLQVRRPPTETEEKIFTDASPQTELSIDAIEGIRASAIQVRRNYQRLLNQASHADVPPGDNDVNGERSTDQVHTTY